MSRKTKDMEARLGELPDFSATQKVMGWDGNAGLAVDEQRKKLCLIANRGARVSERVVSYRDILSVELFEDGSSITKTSRSSQIGGALVGGVLLGGVGAVIGGLSGKTKTSTKVERVDLRLIVNDTAAPLHDVTFLNSECKKDTFRYKQAIAQARRWHGIIEILIMRANADDQASQAKASSVVHTSPSASVADELKKLADLRISGVLTAEEFQREKTRLIGAGAPSA